MSNKTGQMLLIGMLAAMILGALGGYYAGDLFLKIKFLGAIFVNALQLVAILLIIFSMIVGVSSLGDIRKSVRMLGKTLVYFLATTGIAVLIGMILVNIIRPGAGVERLGVHVPDIVAQGNEKGLTDIILSIAPGNIFNAASEGALLGLIIFSMILGGALTTLGSAGRVVIDILDTLNKALMKIVQMIMYYAPVGILALIGGIVAENHDEVGQLVSGLGLYTLTVVLGLIIQGGIILPVILKIIGKQDPIKYFRNMGQALTAAFTTASSIAALPLTMEAVIEKNKVDKRVGSFLLPLGVGANFNGTALYEAVAAIFIAQVYGIDLSIGQQAIIFITAALISFGAAAIPHAGAITMTLVLSAVELPIEGIGLIWVADWFLDRCRTAVNIWGDAVGCAVIAETAEIKSAVRPSARAVSAEKRAERIEQKKPRYERPEQFQKNFSRDDQQHRYQGPRREEPQRKQRRPDEGRPGQFRGRHDFGQRGHREAPIPKEKIEKDLGKIGKQLAPPNVISEPIKATPAPPVSTEIKLANQAIDGKNSFFEKDFSKIDLAGDNHIKEKAPVESPMKVETAKAPESSAKVEEAGTGPGDKKAPPPAEEDTWGRGKRKHPSK